jgi:S-formylglutathione hydrolase FrmB
MKKILLLFILLNINSAAQVSVANTNFFSTSLNLTRNIQVLLPPGYNAGDDKRYPVIYFLHGAFSNHIGYSQVQAALNLLYLSNSISEYIVVKPDGSSGPYLGSFYTNSELYGDFEDYIINDVIGFVESTYKTKEGKDNRFVMGHSMGGFGAMKLALKHPEKFRAIVAHSGILDFNNFDAQLPHILQENGGIPPYNYHPENGIFTILFYTMAGAFSPNPDVEHYVDLPLDENGGFIDSILAKWMLHNPSGLVKEMNEFPGPAIYFDCGTLDELKLYVHNTGFKDTLDFLGLPYVFHAYSGFHGNKLPERLEVSFLFIDSVYNSVITGLDEIAHQPEGYRLYQNYPNPFNPTTEINVTLPEEGYLSLRVYDLLGKVVETIADEKKPAGEYKYNFNGAGLTNGIYFCRMEAGKYSSVIKMILLK